MDTRKWEIENIPSVVEDTGNNLENCDGCGKFVPTFKVYELSRAKVKVAKHWFCSLQCSFNWLAIPTQNLWEESVIKDKKIAGKPLSSRNYSPHFNSPVGSNCSQISDE